MIRDSGLLFWASLYEAHIIFYIPYSKNNPFDSGETTGGSGDSRLRAPARRGRLETGNRKHTQKLVRYIIRGKMTLLWIS